MEQAFFPVLPTTRKGKGGRAEIVPRLTMRTMYAPSLGLTRSCRLAAPATHAGYAE